MSKVLLFDQTHSEQKDILQNLKKKLLTSRNKHESSNMDERSPIEYTFFLYKNWSYQKNVDWSPFSMRESIFTRTIRRLSFLTLTVFKKLINDVTS